MSYATPSSFQRAARAYGQVGLTTCVDTADRHGLVLMLFDGAIEAINRVRAHLAAGRIPAKCEAVSQAVLIVEQGLNASLDRNVGGPLSAGLAELYDYISRRLLLASAANDMAGFDEARRLLAELREAWAAIPNGSPRAERAR
jgi:flagellar protein FliS